MDVESYKRRIKEATGYIEERIKAKPAIAIILGSGLSGLSKEVEKKTAIPYEEAPGFPSKMVRGHKGEVIFGTLGGKNLIMFNGRFHYYQGYSLQEVVLPVRVAKALGAASIIVTNASGGINRSFAAGDLMLISDHINMLGVNPLVGNEIPELGPIFVDMTNPYDTKLIEKARIVAEDCGVGRIKEGVYLATTGPSYETKAEIKFFSKIGADAVGMSTVPEVIVANQVGMKVLAISVIANMACGISENPLSHEEVLENVSKASERLVLLVREIIRKVL